MEMNIMVCRKHQNKSCTLDYQQSNQYIEWWQKQTTVQGRTKGEQPDKWAGAISYLISHLLLEVLCDSNRHVMQSAYQIHQKSAAVMTVLFFVPNSNRLHLHYPRGYITVPKIEK